METYGLKVAESGRDRPGCNVHGVHIVGCEGQVGIKRGEFKAKCDEVMIMEKRPSECHKGYVNPHVAVTNTIT